MKTIQTGASWLRSKFNNGASYVASKSKALVRGAVIGGGTLLTHAHAAEGDLSATEVIGEISAGKTALLAVLGACVAIWGVIILATLLRRGTKKL